MQDSYNYDDYQGSNEVYPSYTEYNSFQTKNMIIKRKNRKRKAPIIILILLILIGGILIYLNFFTDKLDFIKPEEKYEDFDPNKGKIENSNSNSNSNIISNSNINVSVESVSINPNNVTVKVGNKATIKTIIKPNNASNKTLTYESSDPNIVKVNSNGVITGIKEGSATITVTTKDGNKTATCNVTVVKKNVAVTGISLNTYSLNLDYNNTATLVATIIPNDASNKNIMWSSNNPNVATVDQTGKVKGVGGGTAIITATTVDGNKKATCQVTVQIPTIQSITISSASTIYVGKSTKATIIYNPSSAKDKSVVWSSSNKSIATVDQNGVIQGIKVGNVTITATTPNGKKATKTISIRENPANYKVVCVKQSVGGGEAGVHDSYMFITLKNGTQIYDIHSVVYNSRNYSTNRTISSSDIKVNTTIKYVDIISLNGYTISNVPITYEN